MTGWHWWRWGTWRSAFSPLRVRARAQGGFEALSHVNDASNLNDGTITEDIRRAAEIKASDCLKQRGWDSIPQFMYH